VYAVRDARALGSAKEEQNNKSKLKKENKMNVKELLNDIEDLKDQIETVKRRSARRGGPMTAEEKKLCREMEDNIEQLQKGLPQPTLTQGSRNAFVSNGPFASFGEQLVAVRNAGLPGGQIDPRLYAAASGLNETTPSDGGFLLQQDFSTMLLDGMAATAILAPRCNRIPISVNSNGTVLPGVDEQSRVNGSRWGGVSSSWITEAGGITTSKPKFRKVELNLKKLVGACYATDELMQDVSALGTYIQQAFTDELSFMTDDAIMNGTGAGMPLGILKSGCLVSVDKESGQTAKTILLENVVGMYSRMPARNRRNAVWLINQDIEPQLFTMSLAVGTGGSAVFLPGGSVSSEPYASLFGRPVIPIEQAATLGTVGDCVLADLSSYLLADKGGIQTASSIHIRFLYDEQVFRFTYRVDGCPSYAAPLTPANGTNTLSPFVALATRA
jgi:HK97 family phage major capsid protein